MSRLSLFVSLLLFPQLLTAVTYDPLVQTGTIPLQAEACDLHFYGGYLYGVGHDVLSIYDLLDGTPVLMATIPITHSELLPRIYRSGTTLILSFFNDYTDNGLIFYDITNPVNPVYQWTFRPKDLEHYGYLMSGFQNVCRGTCRVVGDVIVCPMNMWDEDPCKAPAATST